MNNKYIRFWAIPFLFLMLLLINLSSHAAITIEMLDDQVIVRTDEVGKTGYRGCESGKLQLVKAYVYTLYRKEISKNNQTCPTASDRWVEVSKKESNLSEAIFLNMPEGQYKATVYAGQAIGCEIEGDTKDYPSQSIVYQQEKSASFNFLNEDEKTNSSFSTSKDKTEILAVFPNPTSGELQIQLRDHALKNNATIVFYNLLGQEAMKIARSIDDEKYLEWQLDVSEFAEGTYVLRITDNEGNSYEQKVLILGK